MAFQLFAPWHLKVGVVMFSLFAVLFLAGAAFGSKFDSITIGEGEVITKTDPRFAQEMRSWRIGMAEGGSSAAVLALLCYWGTRRFRS